MGENNQTPGPDVRVLQGLYQRYLQEAVNLAEENVRLQVRVAELELQLEVKNEGEQK